jgi:DNA-binding NarL/FixJ family response regulator
MGDPQRVLVVDDAADVRALARTILCLDGWFTIAGEGTDGAAAIEQARARQPDVVLTDLAMPMLDGLEALPGTRVAAPQASVVVLTGFAEDSTRAVADAGGATGYLVKDNLVGQLAPALVRSRADL